MRESYLNLLADSLKKNYERCHIVDPPVNTLSSADMEACAVDLEYEAFTNNKVLSLYKRQIMKMVSSSLQSYILLNKIFKRTISLWFTAPRDF